MSPRPSAAVILFVVLSSGCAAEVEIVDGTGGSSSSTSKSSTKATTGSSSGTCKSHDDCPGGVCLFGVGICAEKCDAGDLCATCGPTTECNACASSSCPDCEDCVAACVPIQTNHCDADTECTGGKICLWESHTCAPPCTAGGICTDPSLTCVPCGTSSCCGCKDCASVCLPTLD